MRRAAGALLAGALVGWALPGCDEPDKPAEEPSGDTPAVNADGPCADGTWMGAASSEGLVFVAADAPEGGDGSVAHPYATLPAGVNAVNATGGTLAVYPGTYAASVVIRANVAPVAVVGCGAGETVLVAEGTRAGVALEGGFETTLRGVAVTGGSPAVAVRAGALGTVEDVTITDARRVGLQVAGPSTVATVRRVTIADAVHSGRQRGWGISLADGALTLEDSVIAAQRGYGVYGERGTLVARGVSVAANSDGPVAGVYAHAMEAVTLDDVTVRGAAGLGIHLVEVAAATVRNSHVSDIAAGRWRGSGDGIVVRRGARPVSTVLLEANTIERPARLGIAVDGGDVTLSANTVTGGASADGTSIWATPGTTVTGGAAAALDVGLFPLGRDEHPGEGPSTFGRPGMPR